MLKESPEIQPNKERIALWVQALRSNQYTKIRAKLRNTENGRCCLGVACDVSQISNWNWVQLDEKSCPTYDGCGTDWQYMPPNVAKWFGFNNNNPSVIINGHLEKLSIINDTTSCSLSDIADLIETTYLNG